MRGGYIYVYMGRYSSKFKVVAYKKDGSLFRIYNSAREACKSRHAYIRNIDKCLKGERKTAFNYMWKRFLEDEIPNNIPPLEKSSTSKVSIPIAEIDELGNVIKIYSSIRKASKELHIDSHSIRDVLNGLYNKCNGHMFRYLNKEELGDL